MKTPSTPKYLQFILLPLFVFVLNVGWGQTTCTWSGASGSTWLTAGNWSAIPGSKTTTTNNDIAFFNNTTQLSVGINMNTQAGVHYLGALNFGTSATSARTVSNSSTTVTGTMYFNGVTLNSVNNTIIWNQSSALHTFTNGSTTMNLGLNAADHVIQITGTGGVTIASVITGASKNLEKAGSGSGVLTLSGVNTYTGNTTISAGTLALSGSGSIATSPIINIGSGGTFNVTGLTTALSLASTQILKASATGSNSTGSITVSSTKGITLGSTGGLEFTAYDGGATAPLTISGASAGVLALNSASIKVTTSSPLVAGTYKLIAKASSAAGVSGTIGTLTMAGSGIASGTSASLSIVSGELILTVISISPTIIGTATATAFTTTYGTASSAQSFNISGTNLTTDLLATAPSGFEVSSDGITYGATATFVQSSGSASGSLRIRLKANASVGGSYNAQTVVLSSTGATSVNITTAASGNTVSAKALTITGLSAANKDYDGNTSVSVTGTAAYSGLVNSESFTPSDVVTWAFPDENVGTNKVLTRTGTYSAPSANYTVTQPSLTANIYAIVSTAPTITGITAGNAQLSVAFTAPTSNGGAPITNYEYSIDGGTSFSTVSPAQTTSPLLISSLTNGTTYNVQIRAWNSAGSGAASSTVQGTPEAPANPLISVAPSAFASAFSNTYGTASSTQTITVSGAALTSDLTITAPTGFEISLLSSSGFGASLTLTQSSGTVSNTLIYVRLTAITSAGTYNNSSVTISGGGASSVSISTTSSGNVVNTKSLTVSGVSVSNKSYDGTTTASLTGTASYVGLANGESFSVTGTPSAVFTTSNAGSGIAVTVTGYSAPSSNYILTQPSLTANITAVNLTISGISISNKVYNGNSTATITGTAIYQGLVNNESFSVTGTPSADFTSVNAGTGITVTVSGYTAPTANYTVTQPTGLTADITKANQTITFGALANQTAATVTDYSPGATSATSGTNAITYTSSNTSVATIVGGLIHIVGTGTTTITASQAASTNYNAASDVSQTLTVLSALLIEDFNYPVSSLLTSNNWTAHSGAGTSAISTASNSISFSGYLSSNVGNEISMTTSGEDVNRPFTSVSSGSLYASFIVNVSSATATGDYFAHFAATSGSANVTSFGGRIWVKKDASGNLAFGISKGSTSANINYTSSIYSLSTTYLIVVKYNFIDGVNNDNANLFINPSLSSIEPTPNVSTSAADNSAADPIELKSFCLRQGSSTAAPVLKLDGIRISLNWGDLVGKSNPILSLNNSSQVYSGSSVFATVVGSVAGTVSNVKYNGSATVPSAAGTYAITADFVPTDGNNYNSISNASAGNFVISQKDLTITASNQSKCQGIALTLGTSEFTTSGLVGSDAVTSVTLTSLGSDAGSAAGSYSIVPSAASGSGLSNYSITYTNGSLTVNSLPTVTASLNQTVCAGASVTLSGSGASTYSWNNSITNGVAFTPVSTTTYTVTGTDGNGCTNTASSTVTVNPIPATVSLTAPSFCSTGTGTISTNTSQSGVSYDLWIPGEALPNTNTAGTGSPLSWTNLAAGNYFVVATNSNNCTATSLTTALSSYNQYSYYPDTDGDGYGAGTAVLSCSASTPANYSTLSTDCNDNNAAIRPNATEVCGDGIDNNCDNNETYPNQYRSAVESGDWSVASTWEKSCSEGIWEAALIAPSNQYFNASTPFAVTIQSGNSVTVSTTSTTNFAKAGSLTVAGNLIVNGNLTVTSSVINSGTVTINHGASFVQTNQVVGNNNSGNGNFIVNMNLTGTNNNTAPNGRYWYLGSPMNNTVASLFFDQPKMVRLWSYEPSNNSWVTLINSSTTPSGATNSTVLVPGLGYLYRAGFDKTIQFVGDATKFNNNITTPLALTGAGYKYVANPYTSHIDWRQVTRTGLNVSYWIRNATNTAYEAYNATSGVSTPSGTQTTQFIPPMQGFWVYAFTTSSSLRIDNGDRTHSTNGLHAPQHNQIVRLNLNDGKTDDQAVVYENENASNGIEEYDTDKFMDENHHQVYFLEGTKQLTLDGLKDATAKQKVDMGIQITAAGTYTINAVELGVEEDVMLEDKFTHTFQDLKRNSTYSFTSNAGTYNNRFVLHFTLNPQTEIAIETEAVGVTETVGETEGVNIYTTTGQTVKVWVTNTAEFQNATVKVYDAIGNMIERKNMTSNELLLDLNTATGVYLVEVTGAEKTFTKKVFIAK